MSVSLKLVLVMTASGGVDYEKTLAGARAACEKWEAERLLEAETIGIAVNEVFDEHPGVRMNKPFIVSEAVRKLNPTAANHQTLTDKVNEYLTSNSQGKKTGEKEVEIEKDGKKVKAKVSTFERPDSLFVISKGKGKDGTYRRADGIPAGADE